MKIEKVEKPFTNLHDKIEYVIHIRNLKQPKATSKSENHLIKKIG